MSVKKKRRKVLKQMPNEGSTQIGPVVRQVILGGQDGIVNVLGVVLGVASATISTPIVIIAGIAAALAESISMAAVAYTSSKAAHEYFHKKLEEEEKEINDIPEMEEAEIRLIYHRKGFRGKQLENIVKKITANKKIWLNDMMNEELKLNETDFQNPGKEAIIVGFSSIIGSLIPLIPFFLIPIKQAMIASVVFSAVILFAAGAVKTKFTLGKWWKSGLELMLIGTLAALLGYAIGSILGSLFGTTIIT